MSDCFTERFRVVSFIDTDPFEVISLTKSDQFVIVLCGFQEMNEYGSFSLISHIRVYEDNYPFDLIFTMNTDEVEGPMDIAWSTKSRSLFIRSQYHGLWEIKWEDHSAKKFPCPSTEYVYAVYMSFSKDGFVQILDLNDDHLYICHINGVLIRKMPFVKYGRYTLLAPFGRYVFQSLYYDLSLTDRVRGTGVQLWMSDFNDFSPETRNIIAEENGTNEGINMSANRQRFSFYIVNHFPVKYNALGISKISFERKHNASNYLAEYSASDERVVVEILSEVENHFRYEYASSSFYADISYYYDRDERQLVASWKSSNPSGQQIVILLEQ